jgi:hypothetical protein
MNGRRLSVLALIAALLVPLGPAAAATPQISVDNTASNTIAIGAVVKGDPANALVTVKNGHNFWAAIDLQAPLGGASLRAADPLNVDIGGLYAAGGLIAPGATAAYQGTFDVTRGGSQTVHVHYDVTSAGGAAAVAANLLTVIAYALGASMTAGPGWGPAAALQALMAAPGYADFLRAVQRSGDIWGLVSAIETLLGTQTGRAAIIAGLAQFGVSATDAQLVVAGSLSSVIRYVQLLVDLLSASWNGQTDGATTFWLRAPIPTPAPTPTPRSTPKPTPKPTLLRPPAAPSNAMEWITLQSGGTVAVVHFSWKRPPGPISGYYTDGFSGVCTGKSPCFTPKCAPSPGNELPASTTSFSVVGASNLPAVWICAFNAAGRSPLVQFRARP